VVLGTAGGVSECVVLKERLAESGFEKSSSDEKFVKGYVC